MRGRAPPGEAFNGCGTEDRAGRAARRQRRGGSAGNHPRDGYSGGKNGRKARRGGRRCAGKAAASGGLWLYAQAAAGAASIKRLT